MRSSLEREVRGLNIGPVKSDKLLPTTRHRYDIFLKGAVLPRPNDVDMGSANSCTLRRNITSIKQKLKREQ